MTIWTNQSGRYLADGNIAQEFDRFERISHRQQGECPVRSHSSRTRGRLRSRAGASARQKSRSINGVHRRGSFKRATPAY
jgi:hypothetical protein